jgi:hypothetical protein
MFWLLVSEPAKHANCLRQLRQVTRPSILNRYPGVSLHGWRGAAAAAAPHTGRCTGSVEGTASPAGHTGTHWHSCRRGKDAAGVGLAVWRMRQRVCASALRVALPVRPPFKGAWHGACVNGPWLSALCVFSLLFHCGGRRLGAALPVQAQTHRPRRVHRATPLHKAGVQLRWL